MFVVLSCCYHHHNLIAPARAQSLKTRSIALIQCRTFVSQLVHRRSEASRGTLPDGRALTLPGRGPGSPVVPVVASVIPVVPSSGRGRAATGHVLLTTSSTAVATIASVIAASVVATVLVSARVVVSTGVVVATSTAVAVVAAGLVSLVLGERQSTHGARKAAPFRRWSRSHP